MQGTQSSTFGSPTPQPQSVPNSTKPTTGLTLTPQPGGLTLTPQPGSLTLSPTSLSLALRSSSGTTPLTLSQRNTEFKDLTSASTRLVEQAQTEGVLNVEKDRKTTSQISKVLQNTAVQVLENREKVNAAINNFYVESNKLNHYAADLGKELAQQIIKGETVVQDRAGQLNFLITLAQQLSNRFYETAEQTITLQNLAAKGRDEDFNAVIDQIFHAKRLELEDLKSKMEMLRRNENHQLKIKVALKNKELKEEAQTFDNLMKEAHFESSEEQRKHDNELKAREKKRQEEKDLMQLVIDKEKNNNDKELHLIKEENAKEVAKYREDKLAQVKNLKSTSVNNVETRRIDADERVRLAEIEAQKKPKGKCIVS